MAASRPIDSEDLFGLKIVSDPQISPDGTKIAYVETTLDRNTNEYHSRIWVVSSSSEEEPKPFSSGQHLDFSPRWSPDGRWLAFLSNRGGSTQLWLISSTGGEAQKISRLRNLVGAPVWSPDGQTIACIVRIGQDGPEEDERVPEATPRKRFTEDVLVIDRLYYKLDNYGFLVNKYSHLFTISVFGSNRGLFKQRTFGDYNYFMPAWSPDGNYIAVVGNRVIDRIEPAIVNEIWIVPFHGDRIRLLRRGDGPISHPVWSPDGSLIAYIGHNRRLGRYTFQGIWLIPSTGGEPRELTTGMYFPVGNHAVRSLVGRGEPTVAPAWSPDGQYIYVSASAFGAVHLWRFAVDEGKAVQLTNGNYIIYNMSFSHDVREVAMAVTNPNLPGDIWVGVIEDGAVRGRRVTNVNQDLLDEVIIAKPKRFSFQAPGGPEAEGWILYPPQLKTKGLPAILEIHGGPMLMYGYTFYFEFQVLASKGFAVIFTNPRGSFGYGQEFTAAIRGDWGNLDYIDLMAAVDSAVKTWGLDPNSLGVAGGSYGGYMTNWIVTQTNRFKAAVSTSSISNLYSFFGTSDSGFLYADDYGGPPWELPEKYLKQSPISYAENVQTPLLLIHGDLDLRTPVEQGEQFYTALKFLGRQARMIRFLNETHGVSGEPWHRVIRLEHIEKWFLAHLKPDTTS